MHIYFSAAKITKSKIFISEKDYETMIEDIEKALDGGILSKPVGFVSKVFGLSGSGGDVGGCGGGE